MRDSYDEEEPDEGTAILTSPRLNHLAKEHAFVLVLAGQATGEIREVGDELVVGRGLQANMRLRDAGVSRLHSRVFRRGGMVWLEDLGSTNGTRVNGALTPEAIPLKDGDKIAIGDALLLKFSLATGLHEQFQRSLNRAATRDPLTGVHNRQAFDEQLASEMAYARRHSTPLSLILLHADAHGRLVDEFGVLAGEHVLRELAARLSACLRQEDMVGRYAGETFGVLCRGIPAADAESLGHRIATAVEASPFEFEGRRLPTSLRIATATAPATPEDDAASFTARAWETLRH